MDQSNVNDEKRIRRMQNLIKLSDISARIAAIGVGTQQALRIAEHTGVSLPLVMMGGYVIAGAFIEACQKIENKVKETFSRKRMFHEATSTPHGEQTIHAESPKRYRECSCESDDDEDDEPSVDESGEEEEQEEEESLVDHDDDVPPLESKAFTEINMSSTADDEDDVDTVVTHVSQQHEEPRDEDNSLKEEDDEMSSDEIKEEVQETGDNLVTQEDDVVPWQRRLASDEPKYLIGFVRC